MADSGHTAWQIEGRPSAQLIGRTDEDIMGAEAAAPLVAIKRRVLESGCAERRDV